MLYRGSKPLSLFPGNFHVLHSDQPTLPSTTTLFLDWTCRTLPSTQEFRRRTLRYRSLYVVPFPDVVTVTPVDSPLCSNLGHPLLTLTFTGKTPKSGLDRLRNSTYSRDLFLCVFSSEFEPCVTVDFRPPSSRCLQRSILQGSPIFLISFPESLVLPR